MIHLHATVLTPSLNKSFKFQSEWPNNNSQIYLLQNILKDIESDSNRVVEQNNNQTIITSKVNYSNNKDLIKQRVYLNPDINKIEVLNNDNIVQMTFLINKIDYKPTFDDDYFNLDNNQTTSKVEEQIKEVSKIDSIIYPLYLPKNTHLTGQNIINKDNGERVILTFEGDSSFMLIQETASVNNTYETIPVYGEPAHINDTLGIVADKSVSWNANGIDYYLTSSDLTETELVSIANSINVLPVGK